MMNFGGSGEEEAGVKPLTSQDIAGDGGDGGDGSALSGASGLEGVEAGPEEASRQTVSGNVLLLILVMAVAGGLLYGMRKIGLGVSLDFRTPSIDYPIEEASATESADDDHQVIIQDLMSSETVVQVPLEDLQRNPFELESGSSEVVDQPGVDPVEAARRAAEEERRRREQEIARTFEAIQVNSIVSGSVPLARINGQPVRIGDTVADIFVVRAIHGRTVELEADGEIYRKTIGK